MTNPCNHKPRTATVTSQQHGMSDEPHAATRVCDLPECVAEAREWVSKMMHGQPSYLVLDKAEKP
jgi:hypothetical protein